MVNTNLPGNSYSDRSNKSVGGNKETPNTPKVDKIVKGSVVQKKKSLGDRIKNTMTGDDVQSVGSVILFEVLIPALKNMLYDSVNKGSERLLFGDSRPKKSGSRSSYSYGSMYRREEDRPTPYESTRNRSSHNFDSIVLTERGDAEEVIDSLRMLIEDYNQARVSDLHDLLGTTANTTDDKWGWRDLRNAGISLIRGGYRIDLPRPIPLD